MIRLPLGSRRQASFDDIGARGNPHRACDFAFWRNFTASVRRQRISARRCFASRKAHARASFAEPGTRTAVKKAHVAREIGRLTVPAHADVVK
ncbi:hypothetical protein QCE73_03395 [Caballeronia sp. LZ029]|uniref:hypothetical protein n=1 Tax=Caballeronia sp. LZ029 TaxID=3038564 RepID=UPI00285AB4B7|nr:hypothetical protein [Caballeronia sp. LZ029]MDR5742200.1 hypothetical protein [Caballeronia sp. LZ029]